MFDSFTKQCRMIMNDPSLRNKILFILGALLVFRLLAIIPVPGVDAEALSRFFTENQFLGLLNIFSGGGLSALSIMMLGVGPFITASIIMQLLTVMVPKMKAMYHEEGSAGRKKFSQLSRTFAVPLAALQGFGFIMLLQQHNVLPAMGSYELVTAIVVITAGSTLLMWIGELMSEFGIGNGVSLIIFAGIVAGLPGSVQQFFFAYDVTQLPILIGFVALALIIIAAVVYISEAQRNISVSYARQVKSGKVASTASGTYVPLRVNQAGVMPIIFALSILLFPQMVINIFALSTNPVMARVVEWFTVFQTNVWVYGIVYFIFVFLFTFFYTAVTFEPDTIARNLQQSGAFVPGVRPGEATSEYIGNVMTRITFIGALFLGIVAVLPIIMQGITGIQQLTIGGTALLIAVSVVIDLIKKIDAQVTMREY